MNARNFYVEMFEHMRQNFEKEHSEEELYDWEYSFENRWYSDTLGSRYNYELDKYIRKNLYYYLKDNYDNDLLNSEEKAELFRYLYKMGYKNSLYSEDELIFGDCIDINCLEDFLINADCKFLCTALNQGNNCKKLIDELRRDFYYEMRCKDIVPSMLEYIDSKNIQDRTLYDLLFDDLCIMDGFGFNLAENLVKCNHIDSNNLKSIIKNIYMHGTQLMYREELFDKSCEFFSIITGRYETNNEFFLDKEKCLNSLKSLGELTDDNKREEIFKSFEGDLSSKEKERIKMYK